jgi:hypothetical protein
VLLLFDFLNGFFLSILLQLLKSRFYSMKRERGRVRQQSPVDALLQPRPTPPGA